MAGSGKEVEKLEKQNKLLLKEINNLAIWADDINCRFENVEKDTFVEPKKGKFDLHIRKSIYKALESKCLQIMLEK